MWSAYFVAENITYEYGASPVGTVEVPIYLVSDYDAGYNVGFVELGCTIAVDGDTSMATILDIKASDELKAMDGFVDLDTAFGPTDFAFDDTQAHLAFKVDGDAILHQSKLKVAVLTLQINENFKYDAGSEDATAPYLYLDAYDFSLIWDGNSSFALGGAIFEEGTEFGAGEGNYMDYTTELAYGSGNDGNLFFPHGFIAEEPEVEITWISDLINWFAGILDQFYQIYTEIHNFFQDLIPGLAALI